MWALSHSHTLWGQDHLFFPALPPRPFLFQSNLIVHADLWVGKGIAYFWAVQTLRGLRLTRERSPINHSTLGDTSA